MSRRRVAVTGLGAVTPVGIGWKAAWDAVLRGASGVGAITRFDASRFPVRIAAEVRDFDPGGFLSPREARHLDRSVQYALQAAVEAVADSGIDFGAYAKARVGCIWATGIGGLEEIEAQHQVLLGRGPTRVNPYFIPKIMVNAAAGQIAIRYGIQGVNYGIASACASGGHAIGLALRSIQHGDADVVIAGGAEATITPLGLAGFCALRALSERNDDPQGASRPFSKDRDGFVLGEGAGGLVLEEYEGARKRGARIYCELKGVGMTDDAYHISAPLPDGAAAAECMRRACEDGRADLETVDYVSAHGTSTQLNDVMETRAIHTAFGSHARRLLVSSTKSHMGHLLGAAGAVAAVFTALAIRDQVAPPTINYRVPDPECDLDYVPNRARPARIRNALCNSFGFGGHNVTVLLGEAQ